MLHPFERPPISHDGQVLCGVFAGLVCLGFILLVLYLMDPSILQK